MRSIMFSNSEKDYLAIIRIGLLPKAERPKGIGGELYLG